MLHTKISHTKGNEFLIELVNPQAPNGRPMNQKFVASFADLLGLAEAIEQTTRGSRIAQTRAAANVTLPKQFEGDDGRSS